MGYFRDDRPLYDLILDDTRRRELDELWRELDFITNAPARQLAGFVWFERTDSDFMLSRDSITSARRIRIFASEAKFAELRRLYEAKVAASGVAPTSRRWCALLRRARRCHSVDRAGSPGRGAAPSREPGRVRRARLSPAAGAGRTADDCWRSTAAPHQFGLSHEDAMRDAVASVIVSPQFFFRVDPTPVEARRRLAITSSPR